MDHSRGGRGNSDVERCVNATRVRDERMVVGVCDRSFDGCGNRGGRNRGACRQPSAEKMV